MQMPVHDVLLVAMHNATGLPGSAAPLYSIPHGVGCCGPWRRHNASKTEPFFFIYGWMGRTDSRRRAVRTNAVAADRPDRRPGRWHSPNPPQRCANPKQVNSYPEVSPSCTAQCAASAAATPRAVDSASDIGGVTTDVSGPYINAVHDRPWSPKTAICVTSMRLKTPRTRA